MERIAAFSREHEREADQVGVDLMVKSGYDPRFEGRYAASDRVVRDVLVASALFQGGLHLIVYDGTALHHFGLYRNEVERIIGSVRMTGTPSRPPV